MSRVELEIDFSVKAVEEKIPVANDQAANHSIKIIWFLKDRAKAHNADSANKVTLNQLKKVFIHGIQLHSTLDEKISLKNEYSLARVEMFLRLKFGKDKEQIYNKSFSSTSLAEIDATAVWSPSLKDFDLAKTAIKDFDLEYPFEDENDLYLDPEETKSRQWIEII